VHRRGFLGLAIAGAAGCASRRVSRAPARDAAGMTPDATATPPTPTPATAPEETAMQTRPIPRTGEAIPVIGLGTSDTFDVGDGEDERAGCRDVLDKFLAAGGRVIDSSPMYGRAEEVTGDLLAALGKVGVPFLATKVWTSGKREGIAEMQRSMKRMRTEKMDLMQIHNLLDWKTHLPVLREWKQAGTIRYLGITHYQRGAFAELEQIVKDEAIDFIQLPYNLRDREAEKRLLPAARDTGTAVLVMRPFDDGALFDRVKGKELPAWAADFDCASWAQFFLKFILGHPAVTCPIPATSKARHLVDNMSAGHGRLPDEAMRQKMIEYIGT
jgi:aryl-alcohol dehydrogenase-like predicted oxidoreductase